MLRRSLALTALVSAAFAAGLMTGATQPHLASVDWWSGRPPPLSIPTVPQADQPQQAGALLDELSIRIQALRRQLDLLRTDLRETGVACQVLRSQNVPADAPARREQEERLHCLQQRDAALEQQLGEVQRLREELKIAQERERGQPKEGLPSDLRTRIQGYLLRQPRVLHPFSNQELK